MARRNHGRGQPDALFGAKPFGEVVEETLVLSSLTGQPFLVIGKDVEGNGLTVEPLPDGGSTGPTSVVKQRIVKLGPQEGKVVFRLRNHAEKEARLNVRVSYLGIADSGD